MDAHRPVTLITGASSGFEADAARLSHGPMGLNVSFVKRFHHHRK